MERGEHPARRTSAIVPAYTLMLGLTAACGPIDVVEGRPGEQVRGHIDGGVFGRDGDYLLYLPTDYDASSGKRWPLLVFLHGGGEARRDPNALTVHGPPKMVAEGTQFPFILLTPHALPGERWRPGPVATLLDAVEARYAVDPDRVYVTGLSMGGYGVWNLAEAYPERFAALIPIAGGTSPDHAKDVAHIPTWIFHGEADKTVPIAESERIANALEDLGAPVRFTRYPGVGHAGAWERAYGDPATFEWMLAQKR